MKLIDFYLHTYRCDPEKNKECRKTGCYINGGPCKRTSKKECRSGQPKQKSYTDWELRRE